MPSYSPLNEIYLKLPLPKTVERVPGSFWRPNPHFVDELAAALAGRKVLEIFAGNGYLAALLKSRGVEVTPTTIFATHDHHASGCYCPVEELEASQAVAKYGASHGVLLICWPTVTDAVLRAALKWGPEKDIVFIGEWADSSRGLLGGCANDEFFAELQVVHTWDSYKGNMLETAVTARLSAGVAAAK